MPLCFFTCILEHSIAKLRRIQYLAQLMPDMAPSPQVLLAPGGAASPAVGLEALGFLRMEFWVSKHI